MKYSIEIDEHKIEIELPDTGRRGVAIINGKSVEFDCNHGTAGSPASLLIDNICYSVETISDEDDWIARANERDFKAGLVNKNRMQAKAFIKSAGQSNVLAGRVKAPMPGLIVKLEVHKGQIVQKGDGLMIIEAMKMENEIKAPASGSVSEISVKQGQTVEKGQILLTILPEK